MKSGARWRKPAQRELALFLILCLTGIVLLPVIIFFVGKAIFGTYGGHGYAGFFGDLGTKLRGGEPWAWFLVLSPYLAWQTVRLTAAGWRAAGSRDRRQVSA